MKLLSVLTLFLFIVYPLQAAEVGDAQATPGEQTTNLYRLNAGSAVQLKKLRQLDKILSKNPNLVITNNEDISDLLSNKKQVNIDEQKQLAQLQQETVKRTAQKRNLIVSNSKSYQQINSILASSVRDTEKIVALKQKMGRR